MSDTIEVDLIVPPAIEVEFPFAGVPGVPGVDGLITEIVPGDGITVDDTDPAHPIVSATGAPAGTVLSVNDVDPDISGNVNITTDDIDDTATNRFTNDTDIAKLGGIASGAEVNVNADWNASSGDAQILNKPSIPSIANLFNKTVDDTDDITEGTTNKFISSTQKTDLTDGGDTTLHHHDSDRSRANHTGTQTSSTISDFNSAADGRISAQKGQINGIAELDGTGKINSAELPAIAITETFVVASQAAMLALVAQQGDVAIRSDLNKSFILSTNSPGTLADWKELLTPTDAVLSFEGRTGAIVSAVGDYTASEVTNVAAGNIAATNVQSALNELDTEKVPTTRTVNSHALSADITITKSDVGLGNVDNTSDASKPVSTATQTALDLKGQKLNSVSVKTSTYNASANELIPVDTTSGNVTVNFPTAPADGTLLAIKMVIQGGTNVINLALGGSDVFNKTGGSTTGSIPYLNQTLLCQYKSSGAIWYIIANDISISVLNSLYAPNSYASSSDVTTGTDSTKIITSSAFAQSDYGTRTAEILVTDPLGSAVTTGNGKAYIRIPSKLNGWKLIGVGMAVSTVSTSGLPTVQLRKVRAGSGDINMLSTTLTVDANEIDSSTAATAAVIDTASSHDVINTGDQIMVDITTAGTGTKGLLVSMTFRIS